MAKILITGATGFVGRSLVPVLKQRGHQLFALVRSEGAKEQARALGVETVAGDITDPSSLAPACAGMDAVVHLAAYVRDWGPDAEFERVNVVGTRNLLAAARAAGVKKLVHISTEAVLLDGTPLVNAEESRPIPAQPIGPYARSKARAEQEVSAANAPDFETVVLRPRLIWGPADTTLVPRLVEAMKSGQFAWVRGGEVLTSTCHVRNLAEAIAVALDRARGGSIYFVTDGSSITIREFLSALVATRGVVAPNRSMPLWLALALAQLVEFVWKSLGLRSTPPVTRTAILLMGNEMTVSDRRIREELGYAPTLTREVGLSGLSPNVATSASPATADSALRSNGASRAGLEAP